MTKEEFKNIIYNEDRPSKWREGQFVFNTVDKLFGTTARDVQFIDGIDCFYNDSKIDDFINACYKRWELITMQEPSQLKRGKISS